MALLTKAPPENDTIPASDLDEGKRQMSRASDSNTNDDTDEVMEEVAQDVKMSTSETDAIHVTRSCLLDLPGGKEPSLTLKVTH